MSASANLLTIRSRRVLVGGRFHAADIQVDGEKIAGVLPHGESLASGPVEDLGNLALMPGLVDTHVHVNEPGRTEWEGFATATCAAAAGGITTIVDMPLNCIPVTTTLAAFRAKLEAIRGRGLLRVDAGFWGGVVPGNAEELAPMAGEGVLGFKAFLVHSGIDEFPNVGEGDLRAAMKRLAPLGLPLLVHAELETGTPPPPEADARAYAAYLRSRPDAWEVEAVKLVGRLGVETGCRVHIVHLSSALALEEVENARARGARMTAETCPHYLCLAAEKVEAGDTRFKCAPPIRGERNRERLWQGLARDAIDFVVSDHSPCLPSLKRLEEGDFSKAWGGISSLQLGLPAVWTEAIRRGIALERVAAWMATRPAAFAGLGLRKGRIAPGFDADLVVFDPEADGVVRAAEIQHRHKLTPYEGREVRGVVRRTYLRGSVVFDEGRFPGQASGREVLGIPKKGEDDAG